MNETTRMRPGEELDRARLEEYLRARLGGDEALDLSQFPAGSSNLTYLVRYGPQEFVLRRPPFGNTVKTAHDMRREFDALTRLSKVYGPAPQAILFCDDPSVTGSEFYLMERRAGTIIRGASPKNLEASPALQRSVTRSFARCLAELHAIDFEKAGLCGLGKPEGYVRRQVDGWTARYHVAKTDEHPYLESVIEWLASQIPAESAAAIVHNDYKFDNVMLDPNDLTRVVAVLDWEMVTIGDPLMDLGTTLGYWMSPDEGEEMMRFPFNPYVLMANVTRSDLAEMYAEASGREVSGIFYHYVFGTFKIAAICQQIYARYLKGFTRDQRFTGFGSLVGRLGRIASRAVERGRL